MISAIQESYGDKVDVNSVGLRDVVKTSIGKDNQIVIGFSPTASGHASLLNSINVENQKMVSMIYADPYGRYNGASYVANKGTDIYSKNDSVKLSSQQAGNIHLYLKISRRIDPVALP